MLKYRYTLGYILTTALSMVWIDMVGHSLPPALTLFVASLIAMLYFHVINLNALAKMYQLCWHHKGQWLIIMLVIAITWLCTIYGPIFNPHIYILIYFSTSCMLGIGFSFSHQRAYQQRWFLLISLLGILACMLVILILHTSHNPINWTLIALGLAGGLTNFLYAKQTFKFLKTTLLSATQLLAVRFWLVLLICLIFLPKHSLSYLNWTNCGKIFLVAFLSLIIPIYLNQKGIESIGPEKNSILCGLIPEATYLLALMAQTHFSWLMLFLYLLLAFFIGLPTLSKLVRPHET